MLRTYRYLFGAPSCSKTGFAPALEYVCIASGLFQWIIGLISLALIVWTLRTRCCCEQNKCTSISKTSSWTLSECLWSTKW